MIVMRTMVYAVILFSLPAYAGVYKWVDANGKVQYGDRPPTVGKEVKKIKGDSPKPRTYRRSSSADDTSKKQEQTAKSDASGQGQTAENGKPTDAQKDTCKKALTNFKKYLPKVIELTEASVKDGSEKDRKDLEEFKTMNQNMNGYSRSEGIKACVKDWKNGHQLIQCAANAGNALNMAACMGSSGG